MFHRPTKAAFWIVLVTCLTVGCSSSQGGNTSTELDSQRDGDAQIDAGLDHDLDQPSDGEPESDGVGSDADIAADATEDESPPDGGDGGVESDGDLRANDAPEEDSPSDAADVDVRADGDTGTGSGIFPLSVAPGGRYLRDASGRPFLFHGEAAWSLIAQLTVEEADMYLADRASRGMQVVMVSLIEHEFSDDPPNNVYGEAPFTTAGDFTTPNEAYFATADTILEMADEHGIAVVLFPAYAGFGGGSQGWWGEMSAASAGACRQYGEFLGERYAGRQNLIWTSGGDYLMPTETAGEACALDIRDGILSFDTNALHTTHYARGSTSLDQPNFVASVDINGIYTQELTYPAMLSAWEGTTLPLFLIEAYYESESGSLPIWRAQSWWAMLSGAMGQLSGNSPIWFFGSDWEDSLNSPLSRDLTHLREAFDGWQWWRLRPDSEGNLLVSGAGSFGGDGWATAALTDNGRLAVIYLPPGGSATRSITLDLTELAGTSTATWLDPATGSVTAAGTYEASGTQEFTAPGANGDGDADWVLVLEAE